MPYSTLQIAYHWITFALIIVMVGTGLAYRYDLADAGAMTIHQISGQLLIVVLIARLATRLKAGAATPAPDHAAWERHLAHFVHIALYLCLFAFVITGYVAASGETDSALLAPLSLTFARSDTGEWLLEAHYTLKWILLALFALHVAGAMKHTFIDKDRTLARMSFTSRKDDTNA